MEKDILNINYSLLVIGGSAGSLNVLFDLLPRLDAGLSLSILIVVHRMPSADSQLAELLASKTPLPVKEARQNEPILPGTIYLAPADDHLLVEQDRRLTLDHSPKVHYCRPSIDRTFASAAEVYGPSLVGLLLSGANEDGTDGLRAVRAAGGLSLAQDPDTAEMAYMPRKAIESGVVNRVLQPEELAETVNGLNA
ncbi:chemotaxis protein CheB [Paraflavisolibacter sp. H34]|uniref:chemotaxis protein CheB n=1 Tax=Huijunlia imazamoxiresistens TaxID=3127457 RepID=UPI00301AF56B